MRPLISLLFPLVIFWALPAGADLTVRHLPAGASSRITTLEADGGELVAVPPLLEQFGFSWEWDAGAQQLVVSGNQKRLVFSRDISRYMSNGTLAPLPAPPRRIGPTLFLPLAPLIDLCRLESGRSCSYDSANRVLTIGVTPTVGGAEPLIPPLRPKIEVSLDGIKTIVIDAGHGGKDPGAIGPSGLMEKDVVLPIALKLRDILAKRGDLKVLLTRDKDVFIPLAERTKMANRWKADVFISIHANAIGGSRKKKETIHGYKVYFLSHAKNEEDKLAAMRENAVIELEDKRVNYGALQNLLNDLAGNEYQRESQDLCILLDRQFEKSLNRRVSRLGRGIGQANFWVLNGAFMPSVLIETGFISNRREESMLKQDHIQTSIAAAIAEAVVHFKEHFEAGP